MAVDWGQFKPIDGSPSGADGAPAQQGSQDWSQFKPISDKPAKPVGFVDAAVRGFKRSLPETKGLAYGALAAGAGALGADKVRDWGLENYQRVQKEDVAPLQSDASLVGTLKGENSIGEYVGDTLGNLGGQMVQSAAVAAAGAAAGGAAGAPAGGVGAAPGAALGAVGGLVARGAAKKAITSAVKDLVEAQVGKGVAREAAEQAGQQLMRRRLAQIGGGTLAATGLNAGQEVGTTYTGRADDIQQGGGQLTQGDALKAIGWGVPAGLVDTAAEGINVGRLLGGASHSPNMIRRVLAGAAEGAATEGGTEAVQAAMERAGASQNVTGSDAYVGYLENFAAGALGGSVLGGAAGIRRKLPNAPKDEAPKETQREQLALPPPEPVAVGPDGEAITPQQQREREDMGLTPDVLQAQRQAAAGRPVDVDYSEVPQPQALPGGAPQLPAPGGLDQTIAVGPDGEAVLPGQYAEQQQADADFAAQRAELGLTPDVNAARTGHPAAAPNTLPNGAPLPDATSGPMARAVNVAHQNGALQRAAAEQAAAQAAAEPARQVAEAVAEPRGQNVEREPSLIDVDPSTGQVNSAVPLSELDSQGLADRITELRQQAQTSGWTKNLVQQRRAVEVELRQRIANRGTADATTAGRSDAGRIDAAAGTLDARRDAGPAVAAGEHAALAPPSDDNAPAQAERAQVDEVEPNSAAADVSQETSDRAKDADPQTETTPDGSDAMEVLPPETGSLGIPRSEMPQVPAKSHGGLVKHLNAQGIAHETRMVDAGSLKATQAEFSPAKVEQSKANDGSRSVIVSSDGHIIDGHHQAIAAAEEGKPVKAIVLDAPVYDALDAVSNSPSAAGHNTKAARESVLAMRNEIGWAQRGGQLLRERQATDDADAYGADSGRNSGEVSGRTKWIAHPGPDGSESAFWRNRPVKLNEREAHTALDKFERGERLSKREQKFIDYADQTAAVYEEAERQAASEWDAAFGSATEVPASDDRIPGFDEDLYDLVARAAEMGATQDQIDTAVHGGSETARQLIEELSNGRKDDQARPVGQSASGRAGEAEDGLVAVGRDAGDRRSAGDFQLDTQRAPAAEEVTRPAPDQAGLFAAPTARERVEDASRRRDAERNGQNDSGRTDMMAGGGELFAGPRPEQESIERQDGPASAAPGSIQGKETAPTLAKAEEKVAEGKSATSSEKSGNAKIDDFGETLQGARKHYAAEYARRMGEAEGLDVVSHPLSETWPEPDYAKLLDGGADPRVVAFVRAARDEVPAKPKKGWKLKGWAETVSILRDTSNQLLSGKIDGERLLSGLASIPAQLRIEVAGRMELYQEVGHEKSLKGISLHAGTYSVFDRQVYDPPRTIWTVEAKAKASAFGNWPRVMGQGDTKEEAIAAFKKRLEAEKESPDKTKGAVRFDIYTRRHVELSVPRSQQKVTIHIGKKIGKEHIDLATFDTINQARQYLKEHQADLEEKLERMKNLPSERGDTNAPRVGIDHRAGGDVTPERFSEAFGFRGVQFGNYVEGARRQQDLNQAYDALMDLAGVLGVPPRALSLNGTLGLAFGARGKGGKNPALAHFEPGNIVINLTKRAGAGSLAHEWFHGLDNYFSRMRGRPAEYVTSDPNGGPAQAGMLRPEMVRAFNGIMAAIRATGLPQRSRKLDRLRSKPYWSTDLEMAARSFENYVISKLQDQGASNDYLANIVSNEAWLSAYAQAAMADDASTVESTYPYLTPGEVPAMRAAFDEFFQAIESEPTADGNVRLFSRPGTDAAGTGMKADAVQRVVDQVTSKWSDNSPKVVVLASAEDMPAGMKEEGYRTAEGAYDHSTGTVYLVAGNLRDAARARQVLAHEVIGHYGIESITGPALWAEIRNTLDTMRANGRQAELFAEVDRRYRGANRDIAARETVAVMAERGIRNSVVDRAITALRRFLRSMGLDLRFSEAELRQLLVASARYVRDGVRPRRSAEQMRAAGMAFSRTDIDPNREVPVVGLAGGMFGDTVRDTTNARRRAKEYLRKLRDSGRTMRNEDTGWQIGLSGRSIGEITSWNSEKLNLIAALPRITRVAVLANSEVNKKPRANVEAGEAVRAMHTLYAPVRVNGELRIARLVVRETVNGNYAYDLQQSGIVNEENPAGTARFPGSILGASQNRTGLTAMTVAQLRDAVNAVDRPGWQWAKADPVGSPAFRRWFGESKVVDAAGQPRVVYHGTGSEFWAFDRQRLAESTGHMTAPLGFFFDEKRSKAQRYAENAADGVPADERVIDAYLSLKNPAKMSLDDFLAIDDYDQARALRDRLQRQGHDGIQLTGVGQWIAFEPEQIKSATENNGAFDPGNSDIRFSQPDPGNEGQAREGEELRNRMNERAQRILDGLDKVMPGRREIPDDFDPAQRAAAAKFATFAPKEKLADQFERVKSRAADKLVQKLFDQFRPLRALSPTAFMQAHLSKGTDGALEAAFTHGAPVLRDGAFAVDTRDGGVKGVLSKLQGDHERFLMWMVGNRAEKLLAEGREQLFNKDEIAGLKRLADGALPDGTKRVDAYRQAQREINRYNNAFLDIAERAGLVNPETRKIWQDEFYIPFYREMEKGPDVGPGQVGLVRQRVIERLAGGNDILGDPLENMLANWSHMLTASMRNLAANAALDQGVQAGIAERLEAPEKGSIWTMRKGAEEYWKVNDPMVLESLEALNFNGYDNPIMRQAGKFKRALTTGVTISPSFRVRNMLRDSLSALGTAEVGYNPLKNMIDGWKATGEESQTFLDLLAGGGAVRFGSLNDGNQAANAKRLIAMGIPDRQILDTKEKVANFARRAMDWWQEVGDRSETINRAVIYQRAIEAGKSHLEASYEARDLMNFTSMGSAAAVRALTQVLPFFNARLQGMDRLARGVKANPRRFAAVAGTVAMASALLFLLNADDDDYKALPDYVRDTYWPIKVAGKWVYLPKPFEIGALGTIVERMTELAVSGNDYQAKDFGDTLVSVISGQLAMNPIPQIVRPVTEAAFNYDLFRMAPIDTMGQQNLLPEDRYTARTSAPVVAAGKLTGISPQRLEHMVEGYFGWLGIQALNAGDWMMRGAMGLPSNPSRDLSQANNLFVLGDFVKDADTTPSKYLTRFYDMQGKIDQIYASATAARKAGQVERSIELLKDPKIRMRPALQQADKEITKVSQQIRAVTASRDLGPAEKNDRLIRLNQRRAEIAERVDRLARAQGVL